MELSPTILAVLAFLFSAFVFWRTRSSKSKRLILPPGPPGWPVVGNLFQVAGSGKPFFQYVRELVPKYGPIFTLKMGARTMIILSRADLVHEALIDKGVIFATRPAENPTRTIFSSNKFTVNASYYGPVWRSLRRNIVQNGLSAAKLRTFRHVRETAMDKLVERLKAEAEANGGAVWVLKNTRFAMFCILLSMCFGVEMDEKTIQKMDDMMKTVLITLDPRIDDYLPLLRPFFSKQRKRATEVRKQQIATLVPFIEQRRAAVKNPGSDPTAAEFSYIDTLFDLTVEGRELPPTNPEIVSLCSEFLNGGTDTTATAIEWAIARFIENPSVQSKLYDEIKATVGDKTVDEKDTENMPYLNAVVKELLRKHPPTYFVLTHSVTEPVKLAGYDIPPGTNVEIFLPAIAEDPKLWTNPKKFDPDRFLTGGEDADITGVTGVKMMPFGVGRRICPGLGLATVHINLVLARMVQEFEWSSYPEGTKVDFSEKLEFTVVMKKSLRAMIKPRV
ncbi:cytochrome P450 77A2-like [Cynara cardunculus var. scolymus]|uniref:Cytochrome P450 n=1 Tax=Cynara cardunculus var. scolymus TaxID=59895 RepID=A0A103YI81_CYNCS|nr:cytochrome P450 77A2-like [Cynara cardunculus var. scolymus]KVI09599.1 cytochrome P450 [Cynara cardunculus var. scolymus]